MTITVNWGTDKVIDIPLADLTFNRVDPISGRDIYTYDVSVFHTDMRTLEASIEGRPYSKTHIHGVEVTISGVVLIRTVQVVSPYTVQFPDIPIAIELEGANNNFLEFAVVNDASIRPNNSAGLQRVTSGSGVIPSDIIDIVNAVFDHITEDGETFDEALKIMRSAMAGDVDIVGGVIQYNSKDGNTVRIATPVDETGKRTGVVTDGT